MRTDERIALLDRMRRMKEQEEKEGKVQEQKKKILTLEQALKAVSDGKLELEDGRLLEFETRTYFKEELPFVCFRNFYQASQEEESGLILVNHDKNVSQIMSWSTEKRAAKTLQQWSNLLVNGMAANRMYARILKKKSLEKIEYLCFEVPAGEKRVWNLMFRFKNQWEGFSVNYNCMQEDVEFYGILLEAMMVHLNRWACEQKEGHGDGEQSI